MSASKLKPYPSYTDSKFEFISQFPSHWELKRMQWIGKFSASGIDKLSVDTESDCLMVNYTDVYGNETAEIHSNQELMKTTATNQKIAEHHLEKGDMLFTPSSETIDDIGVSVVAVEDMPEIVYSYHLTRFRPTIPLDVNFSRFFCNSTPVLSQLSAIARGTTRQILSRMDFNTLNVAIPSEKERVVIGRFLSLKTKQITATIQHLENNVPLLEEKRSALITQAVTKGLNLDVPMKEIDSPWIDSIPEDWTNLRIKQIVNTKVTDGPHVTPVQVDEGVPFLSATAVENGRLNMNKMWGYISREDHELYCRKCLPQLEDIFMVKSGATTGSIAFVDFEDEFSVWSPLALIRCDRKKMHPRFVFYSLQSDYLQKAISQTWSKGTQENIAMKAIEELPIIMPPLHEQIEIANYIDVSTNLFNGIISKINSIIEKLKEYQTALISAAVTGKIDVRGQA